MRTIIESWLTLGLFTILFALVLGLNIGFVADLNIKSEPKIDPVYLKVKIPKEPNVKGAMIRAKLYVLEREGIPVSVDGVTFQSDVDVMKNSSIVIDSGDYKEQPVIENGKVVRIEYRRM